MKLLLINLSLRPESSQCIFPIGLGCIATAMENAGFEFELFDMDVDKKPMNALRNKLEEGYDVVLMGCIVTGYRFAKEAARIIRKKLPKAIIICGNTVASSIPQIILSRTEVDIAVMAEGDVTIVDLLKNIKNPERVNGLCYKEKGMLIATPKRTPVEDLDNFPFINWDLFDMESYIKQNRGAIAKPYPMSLENLRAMPVNSARGCIYRCSFCYHAFYGERYRYRSEEHIGGEIDLLKNKYNINFVTFYDDLTLFNKKRVEGFAEMLRGKGISWTACCRGNLFGKDSHALAQSLKDSGCVSLGYSLESANPHILKAMNKKVDLEEFKIQKKVLDEVGIATVTSIVVGYPQETEATLQETFDFCLANNIYPSTGYLQPQPGTPMYQHAFKYNHIKNEEDYLMSMGDRQDLRLNMSKVPEDVLEAMVLDNLKKIRDNLKLDLSDKQLIKTGVVRGR